MKKVCKFEVLSKVKLHCYSMARLCVTFVDGLKAVSRVTSEAVVIRCRGQAAVIGAAQPLHDGTNNQNRHMHNMNLVKHQRT